MDVPSSKSHGWLYTGGVPRDLNHYTTVGEEPNRCCKARSWDEANKALQPKYTICMIASINCKRCVPVA